MVGCAVSEAASPGAGGRGAARRELLFLILASAALVTLLYLTPPTIFDSEDYVKLHAINRAYLVKSLLAGRVPLWNPHVGLGRPFLADIETAAFYPPNLLYLILEPHLCLTLLLVAHTALLLRGWLRLGRYLGLERPAACMTGVAFAASGAVVGVIHKGQIPYGDAIAWVPLLFFLAARLQDRWSTRGAAALALGLGLQVLCGHPQIAWLTWFALALFLGVRGAGPDASRRWWHPLAAGLGGLALALMAGLALAAAQLLPFLELVGQGNRSRPSFAFASSGSLDWQQWASLFVPAGAGPPIVFGASFYIGALLAIAGLAGLTRLGDRTARALAVVTVVGVLYSVGERSPVFRLLYAVVPGLPSFRFPGRMGVLVSLALLLAAGSFLSERKPRRSGLLVCAGGGALAALAILRWQPALPAEAIGGARLARCLLAVSGGVLLFLWHLGGGFAPRARRPLTAALAAVALGEIVLTSLAHRPFREGPGGFPGERVVTMTLERAGLLRDGAPPPRALVPYPVIRDDSGMLHGFSNPSGYVALTLGSVWAYLHESLGLAAPVEVNTFPSPEIYDFGPFPYRSAGVVLGYDRATGQLVLNSDPDPRSYVAHAVEGVPDIHAAIARLRAGQDRHHATIVGPADSAASPSEPWPYARAEIVAFEPERMEVDVDSAAPGMLVVAEAWYPGWRAEVNGRESACRPVNGWMRGVEVPAGRSRVVLAFRSSYLGYGAALSLVSLVLCLAALRAVRAAPPRSSA
jgi:hypothetical protein